MTDFVPKAGVIAEPYFTDAFFAVAFEEGLLEVDDRKTDHVCRRYREMKVGHDLRGVIYKNVVVGGRLYVENCFWLKDATGPLIDAGVVSEVDDCGDEGVVDVSVELILSHLNGSGQKYTAEQLVSSCDQLVDVYGRLSKVFSSGIGNDDEPLDQFIARAINPDAEPLYTKDQLALWKEWKQISKIAGPFTTAIGEIVKVEKIASHIGAYSLYRMSGPVSVAKPQNEMLRLSGELVEKGAPEPQLSLLKHCFGTMPFRNTLRDNIQVASSPTMVEMRMQLNRWAGAISEGGEREIEQVHKEIDRVRNEVVLAEKGAAVSDLMTYVGVPLAVAGCLVPGSDLLTFLGTGASVLGGLSLGLSTLPGRRHPWTMIR